jgi:hypothetical protein
MSTKLDSVPAKLSSIARWIVASSQAGPEDSSLIEPQPTMPRLATTSTDAASQARGLLRESGEVNGAFAIRKGSTLS